MNKNVKQFGFGALVLTTALTSASLQTYAQSFTGATTEFTDGSVSTTTSLNRTDIDQRGQLTIQRSPNTDIAAGYTVAITQDNKSAHYVMKSTKPGSDPTQILGTLKTIDRNSGGTGGRVTILDNNGIYFGKDSRIDSAGIIASSGNLNNARLIQDNVVELDNFANDSKVINDGQMTISDGGLAAFVAPTVVNNGIITAKLGRVELAGSNTKTTVDLHGDGLVEIAVNNDSNVALLAENNGTINAESGVIHMTTGAAQEIVNSVVNMGGVANASSATVSGGKIVLGGKNTGKVSVTAKADTSGVGQAGTIDAVAQEVVIHETAELSSNGVGNGNGGSIKILGNSLAILRGKASAKGGEISGDGGFIELSSNEDFSMSGTVDTSAANGETGTFLLDPRDIDLRVGTRGFDLSLNRVYGSDIEFWSILSNIDILARRNITVNENTYGLADGVITLWKNRDLTIRTTNAPFSFFFIKETNNSGVIDLTRNSTYGANLEFKTSGTGSINILGATDNLGSSNIKVSKLTAQNGNITVDTNNGTVTVDGAITTGGNVALNATNLVDINSKVTGQFIDVNATQANLNADLNAFSSNISGSVKTINVESNAAQIQDSVDIAKSGNDTIVNIAAGTYNEAVVVDKSLNLRGAQAGVDARTRSGAETIVVPNSPAIIVTADNVIVDGFTVQNGSNGIVVDGADNVQILNNIAKNNTDTLAGRNASNWKTGVGILVKDGSSNVTVSRNLADGNTDGIRVTESGKNIKVLNNDVKNTGDKGIIIKQTNNVEVANNNLTNNYRGIQINIADGIYAHDNVITKTTTEAILVDIGSDTARLVDNVISGTKDGIVIDGGLNNLVDDNDIEKFTANGVIVKGATGTKVTDNFIKNDNKAVGVLVENSTNTTVGGIGNTLRNRISNVTTAVDVKGGTNTKVEGNDIKASVTGVKATSAGTLTINKNTVDGSTTAVDVTSSASAKILENIIKNSGTGVNVKTSNSADISKNDISKVGNGIVVADSLLANVLSNKVENAGTAVEIKNGSGAKVESNTIKDIETGVKASNTGTLTVNKNTVTNSVTGIDVASSNTAKITKNTVTNAVTGISVLNGKDALVKANKVSDTKGNGIEVKNASNTLVTNNQANDNSAAGILVNGSFGTEISNNNTLRNNVGIKVTGNEFFKSIDGEEAFNEEDFVRTAFISKSLGNPSNDTKILNNIIEDNKTAGIETSGNAVGSVEIASNQLDGNAIGFLLQGGEIDISNLLNPNTINGGQTAMRFIGGDVSLSNDTLGATLFSDQTGNYIELVDGALFNPGTPTIIDGLAASWDGIIPLNSPLGAGILTAAQRLAIEARLIDFDDNGTLGQILVGLGFDLSQEDVFALNLFSLTPDAGNVNVTFRGLPAVSALSLTQLASISPAAGGTSASDLANIEPAAGGADDLANIEPAAGGEEGCWASVAENGFSGTVNFSFGGQTDSALSDNECAN